MIIRRWPNFIGFQKKSDKVFIYVTGKGGLLNRFFKETLRDEYLNNPEMRALVESGNLEGWLIEQVTDLKTKIDSDDERS